MKLKKNPGKKFYEDRIKAIAEEAHFQRQRADNAEKRAAEATKDFSRMVDAILGEVVKKYGPIEIPIPNVKSGLKVQTEKDEEKGTYSISLIPPDEKKDGQEE